MNFLYYYRNLNRRLHISQEKRMTNSLFWHKCTNIFDIVTSFAPDSGIRWFSSRSFYLTIDYSSFYTNSKKIP